MKNSLLKIALHYLEMAAMFMVLAMSSNSTKNLETLKKVLEEDEKRNNYKGLEDLY